MWCKEFSQAVISGLSGTAVAAKKGKPNFDLGQEKLQNCVVGYLILPNFDSKQEIPNNFLNSYSILTSDKKNCTILVFPACVLLDNHHSPFLTEKNAQFSYLCVVGIFIHHFVYAQEKLHNLNFRREKMQNFNFSVLSLLEICPGSLLMCWTMK